MENNNNTNYKIKTYSNQHFELDEINRCLIPHNDEVISSIHTKSGVPFYYVEYDDDGVLLTKKLIKW